MIGVTALIWSESDLTNVRALTDAASFERNLFLMALVEGRGEMLRIIRIIIARKVKTPNQ